MALNLADRIAVRSVILPRVEGSIVQYALYLLGNVGSSVPQLGWAREAIRDPAASANSVSWHVLDNPDYLAGGSDITDQQLQGAVETAINDRFIGV